MNWALKSIFGRLLVSFLLVILIALISVGGMLSYLMERYFYGMREWQIKQQAESMASSIQDSLDGDDMQKVHEVIASLAHSVGMQISVFDSEGKLVTQSIPEDVGDYASEGFNFDEHEIESVFEGNTITKKAFGPGARSLLIAIPLPLVSPTEEVEDPAEITGMITLHAPLKGIEDTIAHLSRLILYSGAVAILIAGFIAYSLSRRIARPLHAINISAMNLARGITPPRIPVDSTDEIGQIAKTFNHAAIQIERTVEEQKKLAALRKNLLDNVSHDFRTPLSAIRGYSELMLDGLLPPEQHDRYLNLILDNTKYLDRLLHDLIDLSSLESSHAVLKYESLEAQGVARRSLDSIMTRAEEKSIDVALQVSEELPELYADPDRIQQVLINLLENALQYTEAGGRVWLRAYQADEHIVFEVADTGIGIPEDEQEKIWERFYKVDRSRYDAKRSSGLGLAISRQIVELHGGYVEVESEPECGSTFRAFIPAQESTGLGGEED
ncbi:MAG: HAMP domain-containing sensor histidine kinase [Bacillota bacterium]